jgi:hypothetical protein
MVDRRMGGSMTATHMQTAALAVGAAFLLVGILGFIPGITTNYGTMEFAGDGSGAQLLGIFQVSILHNIVHLVLGIAGVAMARTWAAARAFLVGGGVLYLALWIYGLVINKDSAANFVPVNAADDWLHLVLGAGMVALGLVFQREHATPPASRPSH